MIQEQLITRVVQLCRADERLDAALQYGSFVQGTADRYSDVEFWLFTREPIDTAAWCASIAPQTFHLRNEFGADVVFFEGLVRGEFHFAADVDEVRSWPARSAPTERMIVLDRTGALRAALDAVPEHPQLPGAAQLCGRFANWVLLAHHVRARGEALRAVDAMENVRRHLLWMARLAEGATAHWLTPSRRAEQDLSAAVLRMVDVATPAAAWACGRELWLRLGAPVPEALFVELDGALSPASTTPAP